MEQRGNEEKKGLCIFCGKNKIESGTFCACYECLGIAGLEAGNIEKLEKGEEE